MTWKKWRTLFLRQVVFKKNRLYIFMTSAQQTHQNRPTMKTAADALSVILNQAKTTNVIEMVDTQSALGRVLAEDILSKVDVPPADNTQMDGYAVRVADVTMNGIALKVAQRIPAGHVGSFLEVGTAARIFTGAHIPPGADAVVMQELCELQNDQVTILEVPKMGQWIRVQGEDLRIGLPALKQGTLLRPQELGVAASAGYAQLPVYRKIKVATFFTGDELTMPGQPLRPGSIYNSNRDTLLACLRSMGCDATDLGVVPDTLEATRAALRLAAVDHRSEEHTSELQSH